MSSNKIIAAALAAEVSSSIRVAQQVGVRNEVISPESHTKVQSPDVDMTMTAVMESTGGANMIDNIVHCNDELTKKIEEAKEAKDKDGKPKYNSDYHKSGRDDLALMLYSELVDDAAAWAHRIDNFKNSPDQKEFLRDKLPSIGWAISQMNMTIDIAKKNKDTNNNSYYASVKEQAKLAAVITLGEDLKKLVEDLKKKIAECVNAMEAAAKKDNTQPSATKDEEEKQ